MNDGTEGHAESRLSGRAVLRRLPAPRRRQERCLHHDQRVPALRRRIHRRAGLRDLEESAGERRQQRRRLSCSTLRSRRGACARASPASPCGRRCRPATSSTALRAARNYFVSSNAVFDDANGDSNELIVWALSNTKSLDSAEPSPRLTRTDRAVAALCRAAAVGPEARDHSLGEFVYGATEPGPIDTSDSRVLDVRYANGKLWAVLGTAAEVGGEQTRRGCVVHPECLSLNAAACRRR